MVPLNDSKGNLIASIDTTPANGDIVSAVFVTLEGGDTRPCLSFVKKQDKSVYIGLYRDSNKPNVGCDIAISIDDKGPQLQVIKANGDIKIVDLFELIGKINVSEQHKP